MSVESKIICDVCKRPMDEHNKSGANCPGAPQPWLRGLVRSILNDPAADVCDDCESTLLNEFECTLGDYMDDMK